MENTKDNFATKGSANRVLTALGATGLDMNDARFATKGDIMKIAEVIESGGGGGGGSNAIVYTSSSLFSTLEYGKMTVITDSPSEMTLTFALDTPNENKISEAILIFKAGENTSIEITVPIGCELNWADGEPSFSTGKIYEINFMSLEKQFSENKIIGVLLKEYSEN